MDLKESECEVAVDSTGSDMDPVMNFWEYTNFFRIKKTGN
jgi:hypothetical protein